MPISDEKTNADTALDAFVEPFKKHEPSYSKGDMMFSPAAINHELARRIGIVVSQWALLEEHLAKLLGDLLDLNPSAGYYLYFAPSNTKIRIDLIRSCLLNLNKPFRDKKEIEKYLDKIADLLSERNKLIHSHYVVSKDTKFNITINKPATAKPLRMEKIQIDNFNSHIAHLSTLIANISACRKRKRGRWLKPAYSKYRPFS